MLALSKCRVAVCVSPCAANVHRFKFLFEREVNERMGMRRDLACPRFCVYFSVADAWPEGFDLQLLVKADNRGPWPDGTCGSLDGDP